MDKAGPHKAGPDKAGPDKAGPDKAGPDKASSDKAGPDKAGLRMLDHNRPTKIGPQNGQAIGHQKIATKKLGTKIGTKN